MLSQEHLDKVAAFHGHICPGMLIGFKAVEGAIAQLGLSDEALPAVDEEIVAVVENDACGVDAVQVLLGCTYGKSNLIARIRGKMAFSFFSRDTGKSVRLVLKPECGEGLSREEYTEYLFTHPYEELFDVKEPFYELPEKARLFASQQCVKCGERPPNSAFASRTDSWSVATATMRISAKGSNGGYHRRTQEAGAALCLLHRGHGCRLPCRCRHGTFNGCTLD